MAFTPIVSSQTVTGQVVSAGTQDIVNGGVAGNGTISTNGYQNISSGGIASSTIINSGGEQAIFSSGLATETILSSGYQDVCSAGTAVSTQIMDGGGQYVSSGGIADYTAISYGGYMAVFGQANAATISSGGSQTVSGGGMANSTTISGGDQLISSGGVANSTTINSDGGQSVFFDGVANYTIINSGGQMVDGVANFTIINDGKQSIWSGAANSTKINFSGIQDILEEGVANSTTINSGGSQTVFDAGVANFTTINTGGSQSVEFGGVASNTVINSGGSSYVSSGGVTNDTIINSGGVPDDGYTTGGKEIVSSGGTANRTTINSAGRQDVYGVANSAVVNDGGGQGVHSGGAANFTTVNDGAWQSVSHDAVANFTTLNGGGNQDIFFGGVANSTTINHDGEQTVYSGGVASSVIVNSGGSMYVSSGGRVSGSLTIDGGHVIVDKSDNLEASAVNFKLANFKTNDAILTIKSGVVGDISHTAFTLDVNNTTSGLYILGSGANLTGMRNAVFTVTDNGQSSNVQVGSSYTFADGHKLSLGITDAATDKLTATFSTGGPADTLAPSVPAGLNITFTGSGLDIDWNDSTDASGIKHYEIAGDDYADFRTMGYQNTVTESRDYISMDDRAGTFYMKVRAQDNAGNWSAWSKSASITVTGALAVNDSVSDWVGSTDIYKMTLDTAGMLSLNLTGLSEDANLALFDAKGKQLKISSAKGHADENIGTALLKGDYYVKVIPVGKVTDTDYTLSNTFAAYPGDNAGDTPSNANVIGELADGAVVECNDWTGFGDPADYYQLTLTNAGTLSLNLNLTGLTGDANLTLLDNKGKVLKTSSTKGHIDEAIAMPLLAGDYFVKIAPADGGKGIVNNTTYTLNNVVDYFPTETAGNIPAQAGSLDLDSSVDEWVGFGDPADYYQLTLANAGALSLNLTGLSSDANLTLLDSKGKVLKTSANKKSADETIVTALAAGDYLVKVAPADGGKGIVNNTYYNLSNYFQEETAGNSFATAVELTSDGTVHGWVGSGNKEDYYKFEVLSDGSTSSGGLSGFDSNVNLYVYNSKHKLVASSTKSGLTPESIDSGVGEVDAGIYYIKVMLAGAAATGYDLNFNLDQGGLRLSSAAGPLAGSADAGLTGDPLKKSNGLLAG